jgi:hypothetical protein
MITIAPPPCSTKCASSDFMQYGGKRLAREGANLVRHVLHGLVYIAAYVVLGDVAVGHSAAGGC